MNLVIDASLAAAWVLPSEDATALPWLDSVAADGATTVAPWPFEICNLLLMAQRRKRITEAELLQAKADLTALSLAVENPPSAAIATEIMQLARLHGLSFYDASYLELAIRINARLGTFDGLLRNAAQAAGVPLCP